MRIYENMKHRILNKLFAIFLLCITIVCGISAPVLAEEGLNLEVVDFEGNIFHFQNARIFVEIPTSCDSCPFKVVTLDGVEVINDSEKTVIFWKDLKRIEKEKVDSDNLTIPLTDGKTLTVELSVYPEQILSGDTERGEYRTFQVQRLKLLKVLRDNNRN